MSKIAITEQMVARFLSWPLPPDFAPDCGITFTRSPHVGMDPTGTNLLHFGQAKAMLEHCINGPREIVEKGYADGTTATGVAPLPELSPVADALIESAGYHADQAAEAEIVAAGLTAPRVTADQIQALMDKLTWRYEQPEGTTSTFAHAFLGRFYLATGHSACVSAENFNAALGQKYAHEQAEGKARDKLWELEGWALHRALNAGA